MVAQSCLVSRCEPRGSTESRWIPGRRPEGEVGIEFLAVTDHSGARPCTYHVPLTYRGSPLPQAADAFVGTSEHGVLGTRWVYDATRDPVAVAQIVALLTGKARPQAQNESNAPDSSVTVRSADMLSLAQGFGIAREESVCTDIPVGDRTVRVHRLLQGSEPAAAGYVIAPWRLADGTSVSGVFLELAA